MTPTEFAKEMLARKMPVKRIADGVSVRCTYLNKPYVHCPVDSLLPGETAEYIKDLQAADCYLRAVLVALRHEGQEDPPNIIRGEN